MITLLKLSFNNINKIYNDFAYRCTNDTNNKWRGSQSSSGSTEPRSHRYFPRDYIFYLYVELFISKFKYEIFTTTWTPINAA